MEKEVIFNSVSELVASMFEDFKDVDEFIEDLNTMEEHDFAIRLHDNLGRTIRNKYLWKSGNNIYNECEEKGFEHADDKSHYILTELYKYSKNKIMENNEQTKNEENQLEELNILDWLKLKEEYPLSINALEEWFKSRYDIPDAEVVIDQYSILITNGVGGMYLNIRDLYDFFDGYNVRPFVIPESDFPKVKYIIQSKKSTIQSEVIFEERAAAEIAMFNETFYFIEVTIEHQMKTQKK